MTRLTANRFSRCFSTQCIYNCLTRLVLLKKIGLAHLSFFCLKFGTHPCWSPATEKYSQHSSLLFRQESNLRPKESTTDLRNNKLDSVRSSENPHQQSQVCCPLLSATASDSEMWAQNNPALHISYLLTNAFR